MPWPNAIAAAVCALAAHGQLPDTQCTPGGVQSRDVHAICTPGWASRHRHVSDSLRAEVYRRYGLSGRHPFPKWEVDHDVPLDRGGSNAIVNLWPEHNPQPKDRLEDRLHSQVCSGRLRLAKAQRIFNRDWRSYE